MSECPFCGHGWVPIRTRRQFERGVIVRIQACCADCMGKVFAAGHGESLEVALENAVQDFTARCAQCRGTQPADWAIPQRNARGMTRR
jgi:hypothetical protein